MKFFVYIIVLFSTCSYPQQIATVHQEPIHTLIGYIDVNDSLCLREIRRAENDVKRNRIEYSITQLDIDSDKKETISIFRELMNLNNISVNIVGSYLAKNNVTLFCYEKYMDTIIKQKFGKNYIKDNIRKADSLYIIKNRDKVFSNRDIFDKQLFYPFAKSLSTQNSNYQEDYLKKFKIPNGFIKNDKSNAYSYVRFNLFKDGSISNFQVETIFENKKNQKYATYYKKRLLKFVKNIKWIPQKKYGITVNSEVLLTFFH